MKIETYWTAYNEIDDCIYDGTPLFENRQDAEDWLGGQVFVCRPSTKIAQVKVIVEHTFDYDIYNPKEDA